jgi:hypothetical protein
VSQLKWLARVSNLEVTGSIVENDNIVFKELEDIFFKKKNGRRVYFFNKKKTKKTLGSSMPSLLLVGQMLALTFYALA